jgi:hypothetical protein
MQKFRGSYKLSINDTQEVCELKSGILDVVDGHNFNLVMHALLSVLAEGGVMCEDTLSKSQFVAITTEELGKWYDDTKFITDNHIGGMQ